MKTNSGSAQGTEGGRWSLHHRRVDCNHLLTVIFTQPPRQYLTRCNDYQRNATVLVALKSTNGLINIPPKTVALIGNVLTHICPWGQKGLSISIKLQVNSKCPWGRKRLSISIKLQANSKQNVGLYELRRDSRK